MVLHLVGRQGVAVEGSATASDDACPKARAARQAAPAPRRICLVSDDFLPAATGAGVHVQCLARELARRGQHVSVLTTRRPGEAAFEIWEGVRIHRTFTLKAYGMYQALPSFGTLERILAEEDPEIVHYHYLGWLLLAVRRLARRRGLHQLYTYHMTAEHLTQPLPLRAFRAPIARQIRKVCNGCELVIAPSQELERQIRSNGVTAPIKYISNPVVFGPGEGQGKGEGAREGDEKGKEARPPRRPFTVLFAGRLAPEKNIGLLLEAFRLLLDRRPGAELWLAGEGALRGELERRVGRLGLGAAVRFLGFLGHAELASRYAAADVFVLPSLVETQGMTAMEAMHFGKPVLVTDRIASARELVDEGHNGFIVDARDPAEMGERLVRLRDEPRLRRSMGLAGRKKARAYGVGRFIEEMIRVYERLCLVHRS